VLAKEIERAGIPVAHVCPLTPIAIVVGSNRVVAGAKIVHPVGNPELPPAVEREFRMRIVEKALVALQSEVEGPTLF
jgi:betaine reductase